MAVVAVLVAAAAMWGYFTVAALVKGAYLLGVLDGLLLIATVWTTMLILRRRQRQDD